MKDHFMARELVSITPSEMKIRTEKKNEKKEVIKTGMMRRNKLVVSYNAYYYIRGETKVYNYEMVFTNCGPGREVRLKDTNHKGNAVSLDESEFLPRLLDTFKPDEVTTILQALAAHVGEIHCLKQAA